VPSGALSADHTEISASENSGHTVDGKLYRSNGTNWIESSPNIVVQIGMDVMGKHTLILTTIRCIGGVIMRGGQLHN